jgi:hypothetical protein
LSGRVIKQDESDIDKRAVDVIHAGRMTSLKDGDVVD